MKPIKSIIILASIGALTACQSHTLPMPKGSWSAVNQDGFIPPNTVIYGDVTDSVQSQNKKSKSKKAEKIVSTETSIDGAK